MDYEDYCLNKGFEYELVNINGCNNLSLLEASGGTCSNGENGYQSKCIMPIPSQCMPTREIVKKYASINSLISEDDVDETVIADLSSYNLAEFFLNVYNMYNGYIIAQNPDLGVESDSTSLTKIVELINDIYSRASECFFYIKNDDSLSFYKDNNNNEKVLQVIQNNLTWPNVTDTASKVQVLLNFFTIQQEIQGASSYKTSFHLYDTTTSDMKETLVQCYDLSNFNGSTTRFINDTANNTDYNSSTTHLYGTMKDKHRILGATKIGNFNNSSAGNISNFKTNNDFDSNGTAGYDEKNCSDDNCSVIYCIDKISSNSDYTLALTVLNTINSATNINNYFASTTRSVPIFFFNENIKEYNRNGSRLSVVLADDNKVLAGNLEPDKTNNNFQIYQKNSSTPLSIIHEIDTDNPDFTVCGEDNPCFLPLVHYRDKTFSDKKKASLYKFDENGRLVQTFNSNSYDLNIEANSILKNFVKSNSESQKNLFFKISDVDDNAENNSGSYTITLKEYTSDDGDSLVDYFRRFFETIFTFIDGNYISILQLDKTAQNILDRFVSCTLESVVKENCYIYSPLNPDKNGQKCSPGDTDCFVGCLETDAANAEDGCFTFSDGNGFFKEMYKSIITNPLYILLLKFLLVLSIAFYGFGYFLGMTSYKQSEIVEKLIKICFIYFMAGPHGFNFFNEYIATFFKRGIDSLLFLIASSFETDLSSEVMQAVTSQNFSDKTVLFSGAFENLEMIFSNAVFTKILGLAFSGWIGPIYFYLVFSSIMAYITAVITSIIIYLSIQIYMSLIFCFFPLVLIFMLFKKTDGTFKNWLNTLIGFAGQEIFLITTLSFFNMLIYNFIKNIFSYTVCWLPLFNITLAGYPLALLQFFKIPNTGMTTLGINTDGSGMPSFYSILTFYLVGILMGKFISNMTSLGNSIFGGGMDISKQGPVSKLNKVISDTTNKISDGTKGTVMGFYKGMANKIFKGDFIEEHGNKELSERTKKRDDFKKEQNSRTENKMKDYKKSEDYKKFKSDEKRKAKESALEEYYNDKGNTAAWDTIKSRIAKAKTQEEKDKILNDEISSVKDADSIISSADSKYAISKHKHLAEKKQDFSDQSAMEMLTEVHDNGEVGKFHISNMTGDKAAGLHLSELKSGKAVEDAARSYALNSGVLSYKGYNDWTSASEEKNKNDEYDEEEETSGNNPEQSEYDEEEETNSDKLKQSEDEETGDEKNGSKSPDESTEEDEDTDK